MASSARVLSMLVALAALLVAAAAGGAETPAPSIRVGAPFPDLVLPSLRDGSPLSVGAFAGDKLVLHIWASW